MGSGEVIHPRGRGASGARPARAGPCPRRHLSITLPLSVQVVRTGDCPCPAQGTAHAPHRTHHICSGGVPYHTAHACACTCRRCRSSRPRSSLGGVLAGPVSASCAACVSDPFLVSSSLRSLYYIHSACGLTRPLARPASGHPTASRQSSSCERPRFGHVSANFLPPKTTKTRTDTSGLL